MIKKNSVNSYNGFTIVELLATVSVLSVVVTIIIFTAIKLIDNSKARSYQITINNIESVASNYVFENNSLYLWVDGSDKTYQYNCITVQGLIDGGYLYSDDVLKSLVSQDTNLKPTDYIYIERDMNTKAIIKNILLVGDMATNYDGLCENFIGEENINISVEPKEYSREKKVTINYKLSNNLDNLSEYEYGYDFSTYELETNNSFTKNIVQEKLSIFANGYLNTYIKKNNKNVINYIFNISKIDREGPVITETYSGSNSVWQEVSIPINISDAGSGIAETSVSLDDFNVTIGDDKCIPENISLHKKNNGQYNLKINGGSCSGKVKIIIYGDSILDKVIDAEKNGNEYTELLPNVSLKDDTENPTCTISISNSNIVLSKNDNYKISKYGLSSSSSEDYNSSSSIGISEGIKYGYVEDSFGNKGNCSIDIKKTIKTEEITKQYKYTCTKVGGQEPVYNYVSCNASNYSNPSGACSGKYYHSNNCSIKGYNARLAKCFYEEQSDEKYTWRPIGGEPRYLESSCVEEVKLDGHCALQDMGTEYIYACEPIYGGTITCKIYVCKEGETKTGGDCILTNQDSCKDGWTSEVDEENTTTSTSYSYSCASGYTMINNNYCYK